MSQPRLSIVIPTMRRPDGLRRAVESIFAQGEEILAISELVIVDNDPDAGAQSTVAELRDKAPLPVIYVHEGEPGVANARNKALTVAKGRLIAFLDDDQDAAPDWLFHLLETHRLHSASVIFGPVLAELPATVRHHRTYLQGFFSRLPGHETGKIDTYYGCGNSLFDLDQIDRAEPLFDKVANEIGGEDDFLFSSLEKDGHTFVWAALAEVREVVPAKRAHLGYTLKRAFAYGQGPATICARRSPPDIPRLLFWNVVGAGQTLIYGTIAGLAFLARRSDRADWLDKAAQGLGKLLWFGPFELKFYGRAAI